MTSPLLTTFSSLPEEIRDWLSSEEITAIIAELNKEAKVGLKEQRVISQLILRLVTQDLDPRDFINELSNQLKVDYESAKSLAQKIYDQTLKPINASLKKIGIEIDFIFKFARKQKIGNKGIKRKEIKQTQQQEKRGGIKKIGNKPWEPRIAKEAVPPKNLPTISKPLMADNAKPFIIHKEKEVVTKKTINQPSFRYTQPLQERESVEPPVKAEIEGLKVVHYNNFYTPMNVANIKSSVSSGGNKMPDVPVPKSKWFVKNDQ